MAAIMCRRKLEAVLRADGHTIVRREAVEKEGPHKLGNWAASMDGSILIAVSETTFLALVVQLKPLKTVRARLADRLRETLLDAGVSREAVSIECEAIRKAAFTRLTRAPLLMRALDFLEMEAGCHYEGGQGEESVQDMVNEYPHEGCPALTPAESVEMLFGVRHVRHPIGRLAKSTN